MHDTFFDGHDELYQHAKFGEDRRTRAKLFLMGTTSSINMQSLGKIVERAPAVGAKMWCLFFFVCFLLLFFCNAPSPERHAFEECIVRTRIALPFIGRFRRGLDRFFRRDCTFRHATQFSHSSLGGATIFAKLRSKIAVKNCEKSKNRRKSLCAPLRIDS